MSRTDIQDDGCGSHLGFPINMILAPFNPEIAQIDQRFGKRCQKFIFKRAAVVAILDIRLAQF